MEKNKYENYEKQIIESIGAIKKIVELIDEEFIAKNPNAEGDPAIDKDVRDLITWYKSKKSD